MSVINLEVVKSYLRVTQDSDDGLLQMLLDGAESEAVKCMNRTGLPLTPEGLVEPNVVVGICILVKSQYDSDKPGDMDVFKSRAVSLFDYDRPVIGI